MSVLLVALALLVLAVFSGQGLAALSGLPGVTASLIALGFWFLLLVLLITPMRMWKDKTDRITELTTRLLRVYATPPSHDEDRGEAWLNLRVFNTSHLTIHRCYGKLVGYEVLESSKPIKQLPGPEFRLPWSYWTSGSANWVDIGGESSDFLDIAVSPGNESEYYYTPLKPDPDMIKPQLTSLLPVGEYDAFIQIGSESEDFESTFVRVRITFGGGLNLHCKEVTEIDSGQLPASR